MSVGHSILALAGGAFLGLLAYGLWMDPVRPWVEERRWRRDQRRCLYRLRDREMAARATALEVDAMERHFAMPCAQDPEMRPR